jgi:hypothetical protein
MVPRSTHPARIADFTRAYSATRQASECFAATTGSYLAPETLTPGEEAVVTRRLAEVLEAGSGD